MQPGVSDPPNGLGPPGEFQRGVAHAPDAFLRRVFAGGINRRPMARAPTPRLPA